MLYTLYLLFKFYAFYRFVFNFVINLSCLEFYKPHQNFFFHLQDTLIEKLRLKNSTLKVQKKKLMLQLKQVRMSSYMNVDIFYRMEMLEIVLRHL